MTLKYYIVGVKIKRATTSWCETTIIFDIVIKLAVQLKYFCNKIRQGSFYVRHMFQFIYVYTKRVRPTQEILC